MTSPNTGREDIPGIDQPDTPPVPGFDVGWAPIYQGRIEPTIKGARDLAQGLRGKIQQAGWEAVGSAAGMLDLAKAKAVNQIANPLADAAQVADALADRIRNSLFQPLADAAAAGRRWGVFPTPPDGSALPADVMEARALQAIPALPVPPGPNGQNWIVTPQDYSDLLVWIKTHCLPLRYADPARYSQCIQQAEARFPDGSSWWKRFQSDLMTLEANWQPPAKNTFGGSEDSLPMVDSQPLAAALGAMAQQASGQPVPGDPGGFYGLGVSPDKCVGVVDTRPPELKNDPNRPRFGSPGVSFMNPDSGAVFKAWPARSVGPAGETVWTCPIGSQLAYKPGDWARQCLDPGIAACYGPPDASGLPGGLVPPSSPFPPPGEVPEGEAPCVKICGFEDLIEALKPPKPPAPDCPKWKAWRDVVTGECYVQKSAEKPRHSDDKLLTESADAAAIVAAVNKECGPKKEPRPEREEVPILGIHQGPVACDWILPPFDADIASWPNPLGWIFGAVDEAGNAIPASRFEGLGLIGGSIARFLVGAVATVTNRAWSIIRGFISGHPCFVGPSAENALTHTALNFITKYTGAALEPMRKPLEQHQNFLCPVDMPNATQAAQAYLGNTIDEDTARCWIRADGMRDELYDRVIRAARAKLNPDQLVRLTRKGTIQEADLPGRLRDLGFIDPTDAEELWELGKALPGPADVVRFMVRDVDDVNIVQQFGLDDEFTAKFAGLTQGYAKAQGIDEDLMKRYWRSHWSIPSPTQLLEMYHRLRYHPDAQGKRVDLDTVRTALQQQDILPYWIPRLLEVSFRPLRLVDVRRAFFDGSIGVDDVRKAYQDVGYSDENVETLARHVVKQKFLALETSKPIKAYAAGLINSAELQEELVDLGYSANDVSYAIAKARNKMEQVKRKSCGAGIKKRLMRGEYAAIDAQQELLKLGLDPDQAQIMAEGWACERASKGKEFSGAQLCTMYDRGLITGPEMIRRLEQLGWSRDDAVRLFVVCAQDVDRARRAADIKAAREREKELEKARRQAEKDAKQIERAMDKERQNLARIDRLNKARNKAVVDAGAIWAKRQSIDLSDAIAQAKGVYRTVYQSTTAKQDVLIGSLLTSAKSEKVGTLAEWIAEATTIADTGVFDDPNQPPVE